MHFPKSDLNVMSQTYFIIFYNNLIEITTTLMANCNYFAIFHKRRGLLDANLPSSNAFYIDMLFFIDHIHQHRPNNATIAIRMKQHPVLLTSDQGQPGFVFVL